MAALGAGTHRLQTELLVAALELQLEESVLLPPVYREAGPPPPPKDRATSACLSCVIC